jgi:uncharacterized membrane protein (DUF4010 family)
MVVLISGLNFASYLLVKTVGAEHGIGLTGLLGGLVSSTAVTLGFSQRSRQEPGQASPLALGILVAWTVMFFRVIVLVGAVHRGLAPRIGLAMAAFGIPSLAICWMLWRRQRSAGTATVSGGENPFELGEAIRFGLRFGVITFVAKAAQLYLGDAGLYLAGAIAGLTDVDAIALSMAQLALADPANAGAASRTIVIAVASNTLFKAGMVAFLAAPALRRVIVAAAGLILAAAAPSAWLLRRDRNGRERGEPDPRSERSDRRAPDGGPRTSGADRRVVAPSSPTPGHRNPAGGRASRARSSAPFWVHVDESM